MIKFDASVNPALPGVTSPVTKPQGAAPATGEFANTVEAIQKYISKVDDLQTASDASIKDLLAGKNEDITTVVAAVAKADVSFKLLVGVRNQLIEAYKQTMNMQI